MVGTDGSPGSLLAVRWAAREAGYRSAKLMVVHVVAEPSEPTRPTGRVPDQVPELRDRNVEGVADDAIARSVAIARGGDGLVPEIASTRRFGRPVSTLAELSRRVGMLAVGSHGATGRHRRELGSVTRGLLHHAHCPVAVVRDDHAPSWQGHRPVLVGIDGSRASKLAAAIAFDESYWRGVDLLAMHVCHDTESPPATGHREPALIEAAESILTRSLSELRARFPTVKVHHVIRFANPVRQLLIQGERAQLVVVGSHGRGTVGGALLGSVSAAVAQGARAPVIVARRH